MKLNQVFAQSAWCCNHVGQWSRQTSNRTLRHLRWYAASWCSLVSGRGQPKPRTGHCSSYNGMLQVGAEATPILCINDMTEINEACIWTVEDRSCNGTLCHCNNQCRYPNWMRPSKQRRKLITAPHQAWFGDTPHPSHERYQIDSPCNLPGYFLLQTHDVPEVDT